MWQKPKLKNVTTTNAGKDVKKDSTYNGRNSNWECSSEKQFGNF